MEIRFDDQVVLVTGASTGIGAAVAKAFGASGAQVIVHYNSSAAAARSVAEAITSSANGSATLVQADVTRPAEITRLVETVLEKFARIDVLVNNAGGLVERNPVDTTPDEIYERIMDLNVRSIFQMCKLVIPVMKRQGHGNIINVTSVAARTGGGGGSVVYAAAKGAVVSFTRGLARELAPHNIRVNALSPGLILTPFHDRWTPPAMMEALIKTVPMGRAGTAEECVGAVLFLASDQMSSYITGQVIEVNGGMLMR